MRIKLWKWIRQFESFHTPHVLIYLQSIHFSIVCASNVLVETDIIIGGQQWLNRKTALLAPLKFHLHRAETLRCRRAKNDSYK